MRARPRAPVPTAPTSAPSNALATWAWNASTRLTGTAAPPGAGGFVSGGSYCGERTAVNACLRPQGSHQGASGGSVPGPDDPPEDAQRHRG